MFRTFWDEDFVLVVCPVIHYIGRYPVVFPVPQLSGFLAGAGRGADYQRPFFGFAKPAHEKSRCGNWRRAGYGLIAAGMGLLFLSVPKMLVSILPFLLGALLILLGVCISGSPGTFSTRTGRWF